MAALNMIRAFRRADIQMLTCPVRPCDYHDQEMTLQGWWKHVGDHLHPPPVRRCPHPGCPVTGRDPGLRMHIESDH